MKQEGRTVRTIGLVVAVTLLTKVLGVVREALQANVFGTSASFDLYSVAYNHTIYLFTTLAYALCVAAVPIITKRLAKSREEAYRVSGNLICICLLLSVLLCICLSLVIQLAPIHRWLGVSPAQLGQLRMYLQICLLTLPLIVLIYLLVAVFQSMGHYSLQGSLSLPYNLLLIGFLALFASGDRLLEYVLVVCAAWLLQLAMTFPCIRQERFRLRPALRFRDPELRLFGRTTLVTIFTTSIFLWCYLADSGTAASFGEGSVSAIYYADKLFTPVSTTLIYSISVVLFPKYNLEYSRGDQEGYKAYVGSTLGNTLFVIFPFSTLFCVFSVPIIHVLFESGSFDAGSSAVTGRIFSMYALGMAGFCILDLINKAYYTMRKTLTPLLVNGVVLGINLVLNRLFAGQADAGLIAMGTALALSIGGALALFCFFRQTSGSLKLGRMMKNLVAAILMGAALYFCSAHLYNPARSKLIILLEYAALGAGGIGLYAGLCWLFRDRETLQMLAARLKRKSD